MRLGVWSQVAVVSLTAFACCSGLARREGSYPLPCKRAFEATDRDWAQVAETCRSVTWSGRARLAEAWSAFERPDIPQALASLEKLDGTDVDADAAYLAGYIRAGADEPSEQDAGRALLEQVLIDHWLAGRHADASRVATVLSYALEVESFDDRLEMVQLAVTEAERSGDPHQQRLAHRARAEVYDVLGMVKEAQTEFSQAAGASEDRPEDEAITHFKYGVFVLDLKQALLGLKIAGGRLTGSRTQEGRVRVRPDSSPPYVDVTPSCQFV
ncbi:MAG TPA: hypothetical protein VNO30_08885, partial [Kofleriaceae bacterium]|nr:hypothetical protein [Kofleriaceae bacterium]